MPAPGWERRFCPIWRLLILALVLLASLLLRRRRTPDIAIAGAAGGGPALCRQLLRHLDRLRLPLSGFSGSGSLDRRRSTGRAHAPIQKLTKFCATSREPISGLDGCTCDVRGGASCAPVFWDKAYVPLGYGVAMLQTLPAEEKKSAGGGAAGRTACGTANPHPEPHVRGFPAPAALFLKFCNAPAPAPE